MAWGEGGSLVRSDHSGTVPDGIDAAQRVMVSIAFGYQQQAYQLGRI